MRAADIDIAAKNAGVDSGTLCYALGIVLPILEELKDRQSWIVRICLGGFMEAIREYRREKCE